VTRAAKLRITGVVQGVGFRPFVYGLANSLHLAGWVMNSSEGVFAVVEGDPSAVDDFARDVRALAPARAVVQTVEVTAIEAEGLAGFEIRESRDDPGAMTLVSPDIATCPACLAEMRDPADRRHRYPFTNCTNCGPRFTIIEDVPYDRPKTTMRDFPMCRACAAEYGDPSDRRFHAQPNACPTCGPRLYLNVAGDAPSGWDWEPTKERAPRPHHDAAAEAERTDDILQAARLVLEGGDILAIQGLGGFHRRHERGRRRATPGAQTPLGQAVRGDVPDDRGGARALRDRRAGSRAPAGQHPPDRPGPEARWGERDLVVGVRHEFCRAGEPAGGGRGLRGRRGVPARSLPEWRTPTRETARPVSCPWSFGDRPHAALHAAPPSVARRLRKAARDDVRQPQR
jgi:acylphosphatase